LMVLTLWNVAVGKQELLAAVLSTIQKIPC